MALREILTYQHPALRSQTREIEPIPADIGRLIADMVETMDHAGGVGLAGPQIGELIRIFVYDVGDGPGAVINPRVVRASGEETGTEGCLSIPRLQGQVPRATRLTLTYQDERGRRRRETVEGFKARVFQHEIDHLHGILFTDKAVPGSLRMLDEHDDEEGAETSEALA